jgi:hypothetical protein
MRLFKMKKDKCEGLIRLVDLIRETLVKVLPPDLKEYTDEHMTLVFALALLRDELNEELR